MPGQTNMIFKSVQVETVPAAGKPYGPGASLLAEKSERLADVTVLPDGLLIAEPGGRTRKLEFNQIAAIEPGSYRLWVRLLDQTGFIFSRLGFDYEAFLFQVYSAWNAFVSRALSVDEPVLLEVKGRFHWKDPGQPLLGLPAAEASDSEGNTRFQVHDSSLLILPLRGPVCRVPLCFVDTLTFENRTISLQTDFGESLQISWLGYDADALYRALNQAVRRQTEQALALLKETAALASAAASNLQVSNLQAPNLQASNLQAPDLQAAAWQLRPGRGADWQTLQTQCPELTAWLDPVLRQWSPEGYYMALRRLCDTSGGRLMIGIRREQPTDSLEDASPETAASPESAVLPEMAARSETAALAADTAVSGTIAPAVDGPVPAFWLAVWLPGARPVLVVELVSAVPLAQATYIFAGPAAAADWPLYSQVLNRGLEAVDFRRQPVYLPVEKLRQPAYVRDLAALRFCPPLHYLRAQFCGRVIHRGLSGWQKSLTGFLNRPETSDLAASASFTEPAERL